MEFSVFRILNKRTAPSGRQRLVRRRPVEWGIASALVISLSVAGFAAEAPRVARVEPPSWWPGHSHNPVRLLITGENLSEASLAAPPGFRVGQGRASQNGEYLFVDLDIPTGADVGPVPLRLVSEGGEVPVPFELLPALPKPGCSQGFSTDDVIYLIMTDRFANGDTANDDPTTSAGLLDRSKPRHYHGGDLQGVIDRLDYLERLGVTAIWLTPWYDNSDELNHFEKYSSQNKLSQQGVPSTDYHGYGAVDFYAVEEHFGDLNLLQELISTARARGIRVVQDQVANHTGPSHRWVANPPTPTWFNGSASNHLANSWQTWTTATPDPPPDQLKSTLEGWFIDILPDLNQNDPEVAMYLIQNSLWWLGVTGVDAVRQDTLPYVPRHYWAQWTAALKRQYPNITILGELFDGDPKVVAFFQGGRKQFDQIDSGVDTLFDFPLHYAIRDVFVSQQPMTRLTSTLAADTNYVDASGLVTFLGLHDKPRFLHDPGATLEGLKLAFTFMLTTRGTPLIYYGDEIGMRGGRDPDNRRDFPGGWPDDPQNAFEPSGRTASQQAVYGHVAKLLALRRALEPLRRGSLVNLSVGADTYVFARTTSDAVTVVAFNSAAQPQQITCSIGDLTRQPIRLMTDQLGDLGTLEVVDGKLKFLLPPRSSVVLAPGPVLTEVREIREKSVQGESPLRLQAEP